MLANKDLSTEIKELEKVVDKSKEKNELGAAQLKAQVLMLKLLRNIRTNQVLIMRHEGIELIKPSRADDEGLGTDT